VKFFRRPRKSSRYRVQAIPMATLFRWYCYDLNLKNPRELSLKVGMTPISEEAEQAEIEASTKRVDVIMDLMPFIDSMSHINANVMVETNLSLMEDMGLSEEQQERAAMLMQKNFYLLSMSALVTGFSSAFELSLVKKGSARTGKIGDLNDII